MIDDNVEKAKADLGKKTADALKIGSFKIISQIQTVTILEAL